MANTKITDFPNGGGVQPTDQFWAVRNGLDYRVNVSSLQSLVSSPTLNNLLAMDGNGQAVNSGIAKADVTVQGNTFNGESQLIQTTPAGDFPALIGDEILVINPTSPTRTALSGALENIFMSIPAAQVQSDWTQENTSSVDYIKNKPIVLSNPMTAAYDIIYGGIPVSGIAPPVRLGKGTVGQILTSQTTGIAWMDNPAFYLYTKYRYVDNVNGLDTNNGSYSAPYKTMLYSVTNNPTGIIHVLMGQSTEAAFSIPANKTNIDIIAQGTRSALNGFTNKVTVLGTGAGSVRFQDLNFGGGLTRDATCTCGIYVYDGSIGTTGFIQSGNGYTEFSQTDAGNGVNTISAGTFVANACKLIAPIVSGAGTFVSINNADIVVGNATVGVGATFSCVLSVWVSASTGYALSNVANSVVLLDGVQFVRPDLATLAPISLAGNRSIQYTEFNKVGSVLTGAISPTTDWFDGVGLLNASTVTGRPKCLVLDATGAIAEQVIPLAGQGYQFDSIMGSGVYVDAVTEQVLMLRNGSGTSQWEQNVLVCNANGLINIGQQFSASPQSGQTINIVGQMTFYNANTITTANYYVNIQVIGLTSGGQLVNLGTSNQTVLSKTQYAYTVATFSSGAQLLTTNLVAVGIQAQLLYGEANNTVLCNTLAAQMTVS